MRTLADWLAWQDSLHLSSIDLGLERIRQVAQRMQLLECEQPLITVAGTNGKGSTCAMLTQVLSLQGYRVGTYTSPHLLRYNERICIDAQPLADEPICAAFEAIDQARGDITLTHFEFGTLAAMYCFVQAQVDVIVLEVGLGGRLDACNLWDADVAIITSIGIDHVDWLGCSREVIGREKAGIMRAERPVICGDPQPPESIQAEAKRIGAQLWQLGRDFSTQDVPQPSLAGEAQHRNAACVVTALQQLNNRLKVSAENLQQGIQTTRLQGRMQQLQQAPELFVDVAHNPAAAIELASWLKNNPSDGKTIAIFSILADKDINGVLAAIQDQIDAWYLVPLSGNRAVDVGYLQDKLQLMTTNAQIQTYPDFPSVWNVVRNVTQTQDRVVAFGSFLVVSEMLEVIVPPK